LIDEDEFMKIKTLGIFAGALLGGCAVSHAQVPGLAGIPILGDILGGGLPGGDQLASITSLGTSLLGNPETLINIGTGTGLPLVMEVVPILGVLSSDPAGLPDFLLGGGTILTPSLGGALPIPFVVVPL
jgi:hypothetical protein